MRNLLDQIRIYFYFNKTIQSINKIEFKIKTVTGDKEGHFIMIKGLIYQKRITNINIYAPNNRVPKDREKNDELKRETDNSTITVGDFKYLTFNNG